MLCKILLTSRTPSSTRSMRRPSCSELLWFSRIPINAKTEGTAISAEIESPFPPL